MVRSILALSLLGLGAINALPTANIVDRRQEVFGLGEGETTFTPGASNLPTCKPGVPLAEQSPCLLGSTTGGVKPGKVKRQFDIGDSTELAEKKKAIAALQQQLLALQNKPEKTDDDLEQIAALKAMIAYTEGIISIIAPPGTGSSFTHGRRSFTLPPDYATNTKKVIEELEIELIKLQNKRTKTSEDLSDIKAIKSALQYLAGITSISAPPGTGSTFTPGKRSFTLPPDYATNTKKVIETLEIELIKLQNKRTKTSEDLSDIKAIKSALQYLAGITSISAPPGTGSTFTPGKRSFTLPPDYQTNTKEVIKQLEVELVKLQNKKNKTAEELADIKAIKAALQYLAGITQISAPPGDGTIFVPGKRSFTLPPDYQTNTKEVIKQLEVELVKLQNKKNKSAEEVADIKAIKAALQYLAGITQISAPPGDGTIFVPGKRAVVSYGAECSKLDSAELALESLIHKSSYNQLSVSEYLAMEQLKHYLLACGITIIKSPDGTTTIIKPSDKKRDVDEDVIIPAETEASFDLAGLQEGYAALMEALDGSRPSFTTWLVIQQIADLLEIYGITVDRGLDAEPSSEVSASKRQTIGTKACALTETKGLQTVLAQLTKAYGNPATAPAAIYLVEQFIVTALQLCSTPVAGWTTLTPATPIPGAPIIPDKTIPGAPITPDPYYPGSPIVVSDKRANTEGEADPAALLAALNLLVQRYSAPGAGPIPAPVFLIMVNIASILQGYPGVAIPAWPPVLGPGTVVIGPSS